MRFFWRKLSKKEPDVDYEKAIAAARSEREKSERLWDQAQGTLSVLREMHRRNHIDRLLDTVVTNRDQQKGES